jgi:hypothetical protein
VGLGVGTRWYLLGAMVCTVPVPGVAEQIPDGRLRGVEDLEPLGGLGPSLAVLIGQLQHILVHNTVGLGRRPPAGQGRPSCYVGEGDVKGRGAGRGGQGARRHNPSRIAKLLRWESQRIKIFYRFLNPYPMDFSV